MSIILFPLEIVRRIINGLVPRHEDEDIQPLDLPLDRCIDCDYSLVGSLEAGCDACPECGRRIPGWQKREWQRSEKKKDSD